MKQEHATTEQLIDYLHGELSPDEDATIMMHMQHCETCGAAYDQQARLSEALRAYGRTTESELPQGVAYRIWDQIDRERHPSFAARLAALWRPAFAVPAAAVLVIAAFFGYSAAHHVSVTTIDASYYLQDHAALTGTVPFGEGSIVPSGLRGDANVTAEAAPPAGVNDGSLVAVR
jgi:anti-sigma factor RsiW